MPHNEGKGGPSEEALCAAWSPSLQEEIILVPTSQIYAKSLIRGYTGNKVKLCLSHTKKLLDGDEYYHCYHYFLISGRKNVNRNVC